MGVVHVKILEFFWHNIKTFPKVQPKLSESNFLNIFMEIITTFQRFQLT